jgi:hypothetical protein
MWSEWGSVSALAERDHQIALGPGISAALTVSCCQQSSQSQYFDE